MRRRIIYVATLLCLLTVFSGCSILTKTTAAQDPDISQVRNICNMATLDCYYHNVAKSVKYKESGITHLGEKDRTFWIEYTGIARLGIDMSKVSMSIDENVVSITIPEAKVMSITIDNSTLGEDSYIISDDGLNKNKITATDQTQAITKAQEEMENTVKNNASLLLSAQNRAKVLIENYILQLGEAAGIEYTIQWKYVEEDDDIVHEDSNSQESE
jgi:hypothetical protein